MLTHTRRVIFATGAIIWRSHDWRKMAFLQVWTSEQDTVWVRAIVLAFGEAYHSQWGAKVGFTSCWASAAHHSTAEENVWGLQKGMPLKVGLQHSGYDATIMYHKQQ